MPILGIIASQITGKLSTNSYESIATVNVGVLGSSSISFTSIPSTYKHLQIRALTRDDRSSIYLYDTYFVTFNGDTGSNYSQHLVYGQSVSGSSPIVDQFGSASQTKIQVYTTPVNISTTQIFGAQIIDILDYANTSKNKTLRGFGGVDENGSGLVSFGSGAWFNTAAITSVTITGSSSTNFVQNSTFALYGIKG